MSQSQFPKAYFSQFTEDELKKISESFKSSVNWTEHNKWLKEGQPFEEHEEIELFINRGNEFSQRQVSAGKSIYLCSFCCFILYIYIWLTLFFLKEPNDVTLSEIENRQLEASLTKVEGRTIQRPGKTAILQLPPQDPKPPLVTTVNIVVKF